MESPDVINISEKPIDWYGLYVLFEEAYTNHIASKRPTAEERYKYTEEHRGVLSLQDFATEFYCMDTHERDQMMARWRDGHETWVKNATNHEPIKTLVVELSPIREGYQKRYKELAEMKRA